MLTCWSASLLHRAPFFFLQTDQIAGCCTYSTVHLTFHPQHWLSVSPFYNRPSAMTFLRLFWEITRTCIFFLMTCPQIAECIWPDSDVCTQRTHLVTCPQIPGCCMYSILNFLCLLSIAGPNFRGGRGTRYWYCMCTVY
jgi:hypothetical protein